MRGLGIDAGAGSISLAVVEDGRLIYSRYALHKGDAKHTLCEMLETMKKELNHTYPGVIEYAAVNRAAAFLFPEAGEMEMADRVTALLAGQKLLYPEAQSILEIGAQTSCFLTGLGRDQVMEYAVNGERAAGTGAFFEDQMYRLPLESYSDYTDRATSVPRLAGRCSVFAKTDLIHRQQEGVSAEDILLGLAYAVVRNFKTSVVRKHPVRKPVLLSGGVVKNRGVIRAVKEIFGLEDGEMVCDDCGTVVSAAGLAMLAMEWKVRVDWEWICGETSEPVGTRMCENADTCDMGMACSVEGQEAASENQEPGESGKMLPPYQYEKDPHTKTRRIHVAWRGCRIHQYQPGPDRRKSGGAGLLLHPHFRQSSPGCGGRSGGIKANDGPCGNTDCPDSSDWFRPLSDCETTGNRICAG